MRFVALVSGGKDSFYSILEAVRQGHELVACGHLAPAPAPARACQVGENENNEQADGEEEDGEEEEAGLSEEKYNKLVKLRSPVVYGRYVTVQKNRQSENMKVSIKPTNQRSTDQPSHHT